MIQFSAGNIKLDTSFSGDEIISRILSKRENLGFIDVDTITDIEQIQKYTKQVWNDFDTIVVLGIGGSALGTKALLEGLYGKYYNENIQKEGKNIYVLDNIDPESISDLEEIIDISRTLFVFISKSGNTIETLSEYIYFRKKCKAISPDWKKHFCFIVGENCKMQEELSQEFPVFFIPENIGGRFSVFTPVGLLPLAFSGIDISLFLQGIFEIKDMSLDTDIQKNTALYLAVLQYQLYKQGKNIAVFFPYSSRFFQVGEWYKQLMGESIGKSELGITLTSSIGVTDQHSQLQLFQDGPRDKFFITLGIKEHKNILVDSDITSLSFGQLLQIEKYGTQTSLRNESIPVCDISLESIDPQNIAQLLYTFMFQIAFLGELLDINAFDQPGVEKSKIITKQKLQEEIGEIDLFHHAFYDKN